jgi:YjjG family noncanonical pyrimidine nucleotidase
LKAFKHKKHLFFDLDHTLWDFDKNSELAFATIFEKHKLNVDLSEFIKSYVPINQHYWKLYQQNRISHEDLRYYRLKDVFDLLQHDVSDDLIALISEDYIYFLPENNHLFDGAIELLDYLKPNYKLHIITNGFASVQAKKIKNANLDSYFETITNSEMAGEKKPHQHIFNYALKQANASKSESLMIGDSYEADILGAIDAGLDVVFFNVQNQKIEQDIIQINHLSQLKTIF